jgi:predicted dehydrogenase
MPPRTVRVGVIGTSWWVDLMYVPSLASHPGAEVVAVCGRDGARADEIAKKFGAPRVFRDYRELIGKGGCDAVVISTPDDLHCEMALAALASKLHVLCEKPLANNAGDARLMAERARAAGVRHMVLFTWRFQPHWRYVKHLIDSGFIGRCRFAEFGFLSGFALDPGYKWRFDGRRANGVTGDLGSHMIDFARWYVGEVAAVRADLHTCIDQSGTANPPPAPANDLGLMSLEFAGGARAEIVVSAVTNLGDEGARISARFHGETGSIEVRHALLGSQAGVSVRGARGPGPFEELPIPAAFLDGDVDPAQLLDPYLKQSAGPRQFIDAILNDTPAEPDFEVGMRVQQVVDAALRSAAAGGGWVKLSA